MHTDIDSAIAFVLSIPAISSTGTQGSDLLRTMLEAYKAPNVSGQVFYREYYVAAKYLQLDPDTYLKSYSASGDSSFTQDLALMIKNLLDLQAAEDEELGLIVPDAYQRRLTGSFQPGRQAWNEPVIEDLGDRYFTNPRSASG